MKQRIVKGVRKVLPRGLAGEVETVYRKNRARALALRYGYPAHSLRVIAVTGTNGKTTTVNYLNSILKAAGYRTAMFSTATIEINGEARRNDLNATVASTAEMQRFFAKAKHAGVDFVVMEFPSHAIHQYKLYGVPVEVAIMTNLTQDHLDYHGTMEAYAAVKGRLFANHPRFIVLNRDDEWFGYFNQFDAAEQKMTYGQHSDAEAHIDKIHLMKKGTEAAMTIDHQTKLELATYLPGEYNAYNLAAAVSGAYLLGVPLDAIVDGAADLEAVPGRFQYIETGKPYDVVVDYAHTPDGLEKLLETAKSIAKNRVILVFGATGDRDQGKRPKMGAIAARLADRIFLTDEENYTEEASGIRAMVYDGIKSVKGGDAKTTEIADRGQAIMKALDVATKGDMVLITGLGHEVYRIIDGERTPWNDAEIVSQILSEQSKSGPKTIVGGSAAS